MSSTDELRVIKTQISDYFDKLSLNLVSTANALPSFEDYVELLVSDSLITDAILGSDRAASYSTGALVDTAHLAAAITREFNMRAKTKAQYFLDGQDDSARVTDFIQTLYGRYLNYYRGTSPEQSKE